jgi:hypothetical protein
MEIKWRTCGLKYLRIKTNISQSVFRNNANVAQEFVAYFTNVNLDTNACVKAKHDFDNLRINHLFSAKDVTAVELITVELVD